MIRNSTSGNDNDDPERGGRRPLVIDNQGRQMLNDIKNALSHHLKTSKPEGEMSPNIIKPISAPGKSRKAYNKQAMEAIHNSLRPFQHGKDEKNGHSSATSTQGSDESEKNDVSFCYIYKCISCIYTCVATKLELIISDHYSPTCNMLRGTWNIWVSVC